MLKHIMNWSTVAVLVATSLIANADTPVRTGVAGASNAFAIDLFETLADGETANVLYSPLSIELAFAMTYAGARGETATEMERTLRLDRITQTGVGVHEAFAGLSETLLAPQVVDTVKLGIANRLWGQSDYEFLDSYLNVTRESYGAELTRLDLAGDSEGSRQVINTWVSERTEGRIPELLASGSVTSDTRLVLTNAIYFKGRWVKVFDKDRTYQGSFRTLHGIEGDGAGDAWSDVPMMQQRAAFKYAAQDDVQVLEMPYEGERLAMDVILPGFDVPFADFESSLTEERIEGLLGTMTEQEVIVDLPQWKVEAEIDLGQTMPALGMTSVFSPTTADLSGMTGARELYVSSAVHKAFIEVNEDGTEAAAATALSVGTTSMPAEPMFTANRPFVYLIRDLESGAILFMGRLVEP